LILSIDVDDDACAITWYPLLWYLIDADNIVVRDCCYHCWYWWYLLNDINDTDDDDYSVWYDDIVLLFNDLNDYYTILWYYSVCQWPIITNTIILLIMIFYYYWYNTWYYYHYPTTTSNTIFNDCVCNDAMCNVCVC